MHYYPHPVGEQAQTNNVKCGRVSTDASGTLFTVHTTVKLANPSENPHTGNGSERQPHPHAFTNRMLQMVSSIVSCRRFSSTAEGAKKNIASVNMKVLYVGRDRDDPSEFCPGSLVCMSLVEKLDDDAIQIQDCSILRQSQELPDWLNGTPILIDRNSPMPLRGTQAVRMLQSILKIQDERRSARAARPEKPKPPPRGAMPRMQPIATRQPSSQSQSHERQEQPPPNFGLLGTNDNEDDEDDVEPMDTMSNGAAANVQIRDDKVTEDDLQRYMEARKQSAASAPPTTQV